MKKFVGNLKDVNPSRIIDSRNNNDLDGFFLTLGLIYNDLKGLTLFFRLFFKEYEDPEGEIVPSPHLGEYGGVKTQLTRLMIGFISESLVFLKHNQTILNSYHFMELEKNMDTKRKEYWKEIKDTLTEKSKTKSDTLLNKLLRIRANVVYHYYDSEKGLKKGFKSHFSQKDILVAQKAYYSLGPNMEHTRFYYADAAVQKYVMDLLITDERKYFEELVPLANKMNGVFMFLLAEYIERKSKAKL